MSRSPFGAFRLEAIEGSLVVHPLVGPNQGECFDLPRIALSSLIWMTTLVKQFYSEHGRCMSLVLTLDLRRRRWAPPRIPTQRCWAGGCAWSLSNEDLAGLNEGIVVAGTLTATTMVDLGEFAVTVPKFDGIHLVRGVGDAADLLLSLFMVSGEVEVIEGPRLLEDDWARTLELHAARMELE
jgi:hypothetical protein